MPEIVEAHLFQAVPLDEGGELRGQVIGLHPLAQLVHEHKAVVFVVVAVAADLLVQLLRRLADSCSMTCVCPPTLTEVTVRLMVSVPRSKSIASHLSPSTSPRRKP